MKATYKEIRHLSTTNLQTLCIRKNWYTGGTNKEYDHLFDLARRKTSLSTEDIIEIAEDIYEHTSCLNLHDYRIEDIAYEVNLVCTVVFEEVESK